MPNSVIKNPRRIVSHASGSSDPRVDTLAANEFKVLYWASVSSASGTITIPTGATILVDQLPGGKDAWVSTISGGQPTGDFPQTTTPVLVTVSSFDTSGNYTLSGTPSAFPVAIVYLLKISALNWGNLTTANILEDDDYNLYLNRLQIGIVAPVGPSGSINVYQNPSGLQKILVAENNNHGFPTIEFRTATNAGVGTFPMGRISQYPGSPNIGGTITGTSINYTGVLRIDNDLGNYQATSTSNGVIAVTGGTIYNIIGQTSTNLGTRLDSTGLKIGAISTLDATGFSALTVTGASTPVHIISSNSNSTKIGFGDVTSTVRGYIGADSTYCFTAWENTASKSLFSVTNTAISNFAVVIAPNSTSGAKITYNAKDKIIFGDETGGQTTINSTGSNCAVILTVNGVTRFTANDSGNTSMFGINSGLYSSNFAGHTFTGVVQSSGAIVPFAVSTPANTNQTLSTETIGVRFNMSATIQHATGAIPTNRDFLIEARTHSFVGASTITDTGTLVIDNAPQAGTNATITNAYALWTQAGKIRFQGLPTSSVGLQAGDVWSNLGVLTIV